MLIKQVIITGASSIEAESQPLGYTNELPWQGTYPGYDKDACAHFGWDGATWRISPPMRC